MNARLSYEEHIERLVAEAPPLSDDQKARLAMLLLPHPDEKRQRASDLVPTPLAADSLREVLDRG